MAEFEATVNNLQTQLNTVQAAIEGNSQASMFKPRPFSGLQSEDVNEWLSKFERFAKFYNWSNARKLGALGLLFEGAAQAWFQTLPDETINNYSTLVEQVKARFGAQNINFILRQELYSRKQNPQESLSSYTEDVIKRCQRLGLQDQDLMNIFINGLSSELKSHVVLNQPQTFSEAENLARLREAVSKSTGASPSQAPQSNSFQDQRIKELEGQVSLLMSLANTNKESALPVQSMSHDFRQEPATSSDIQTLVAALQNATLQNNSNLPRGRFRQNFGNSRGRNLRTRDGQPICNKCYKVGHIARNCLEGYQPPPRMQPSFQPQIPPYQGQGNTRYQASRNFQQQGDAYQFQGQRPNFYDQSAFPPQQNLNGAGPSQWGN